MIYTDRLQKIQLAIMDGREIEPLNDEEKVFIEKSKREIEEIKAHGGMIDIAKD